MKDPSHTWGPHKQGIRWSQCQTCDCLLHEPEAEEPCTGNPEYMKVQREARTREARRKMAEVARRESSWRP